MKALKFVLICLTVFGLVLFSSNVFAKQTLIYGTTEKIIDMDAREGVAVASLRQMWMATAPVILVLTAEYGRITIKYGDRGKRYAMIEVGHIGQNIFLQCEAMGICAGIVGAFYDTQVAGAIKTQKNHEPLIIMPLGYRL